MKTNRWFLLVALLLATETVAAPGAVDVNSVAEGYVKMVLEVGLYDTDYIDAYFGPKEWIPLQDRAEESFPAPRLRAEADVLIGQLEKISRDEFAGLERLRYDYLDKQLRSVRGKIDLLAGVKMSFDEESRVLYDAVAPAWDEKRYQAILDELDRLLPGDETLYWRFNQYKAKFTVNRNKIRQAIRTALEAYRQRTRERLALPVDEGYEMQFVFGKPWAASLNYHGDGRSRIEINSSAPFCVADIVRIARHETYPGHHTHFTLLETQLVNRRGWIEFCVVPLHSPLALVAEGLAEYAGYDLFPHEEQLEFERTVLFPLMEIDPAEAETQDKIMILRAALDGAFVEGARRYLDGQINASQTRDWMRRYSLVTPGSEMRLLRFIEEYRSYVINYTVGRQLVRDYIDRHGGATDPAQRWRLFHFLLSTPQTPSALARR